MSLDYFAVAQGRKVSSNKKNDKSLSIRELISLNLKRLRLERRLTQTKIAQNIGISNVAYGQYESKKREPSADMREKISEALNIDELDLIRRPSNEIKSSDDLSKFRDLRKAFFLFQSALGSFDPSLTDGNIQISLQIFLKN
ncbi:helix-turn-helix domain-containing protein [Halobacteriovorax sp. CON-3]|uniref:helix-turn-helix domain-containing protein n=1 Tax=Halobacteriovorax sp. CON-3 TaxID=3157710 RepID=UPI00371F7402